MSENTSPRDKRLGTDSDASTRINSDDRDLLQEARGVGPVTADRLAATYPSLGQLVEDCVIVDRGEQTSVDDIDEARERLTSVDGVGEARAETLATAIVDAIAPLSPRDQFDQLALTTCAQCGDTLEPYRAGPSTITLGRASRTVRDCPSCGSFGTTVHTEHGTHSLTGLAHSTSERIRSACERTRDEPKEIRADGAGESPVVDDGEERDESTDCSHKYDHDYEEYDRDAVFVRFECVDCGERREEFRCIDVGLEYVLDDETDDDGDQDDGDAAAPIVTDGDNRGRECPDCGGRTSQYLDTEATKRRCLADGCDWSTVVDEDTRALGSDDEDGWEERGYDAEYRRFADVGHDWDEFDRDAIYVREQCRECGAERERLRNDEDNSDDDSGGGPDGTTDEHPDASGVGASTLRRFRERAKLSQYELADLADVSRSSVYHAEHGRDWVTDNVRSRLLRALLATEKTPDLSEVRQVMSDGGAVATTSDDADAEEYWTASCRNITGDQNRTVHEDPECPPLQQAKTVRQATSRQIEEFRRCSRCSDGESAAGGWEEARTVTCPQCGNDTDKPAFHIPSCDGDGEAVADGGDRRTEIKGERRTDWRAEERRRVHRALASVLNKDHGPHREVTTTARQLAQQDDDLDSWAVGRWMSTFGDGESFYADESPSAVFEVELWRTSNTVTRWTVRETLPDGSVDDYCESDDESTQIVTDGGIDKELEYRLRQLNGIGRAGASDLVEEFESERTLCEWAAEAKDGPTGRMESVDGWGTLRIRRVASKLDATSVVSTSETETATNGTTDPIDLDDVDRTPPTCEWGGCGRPPDSDGLCDRHARRDDGLRTSGGVEVPKQTETVDYQRAKAADTTSWTRAVDEDAEIQPDGSLGHYRVQLGDGDEHETFLAQINTGEWAGRCDCDGWAHHRHPDDDQLDLSLGNNHRSHPCAHLCALRQHEAVGGVECPTIDEAVVSDLAVEVVDHAPDDGGDERDDSDGPEIDPHDNDVGVPPEEFASDDAGAASATETETVAPATPDEEAVESHQEFVEKIAGVPSVFVVSMGRGESAKPYVTKEGLNYLARKMGVETRAEPLSPSWEDNTDVAAYRGVAVDDEGRRYEDIATAHAEQVESTVGRENLDELASTRATNRALRLATGCGYASAEEVDESAGIDPDPEVRT